MSLVLLLARLLLACVFIVAGAAKLADLHGSRQAMRDFGVPSLLATPLGTLLPIAELDVGVALLPALTAWWAALGALILLVVVVVGPPQARLRHQPWLLQQQARRRERARRLPGFLPARISMEPWRHQGISSRLRPATSSSAQPV